MGGVLCWLPGLVRAGGSNDEAGLHRILPVVARAISAQLELSEHLLWRCKIEYQRQLSTQQCPRDTSSTEERTGFQKDCSATPNRPKLISQFTFELI